MDEKKPLEAFHCQVFGMVQGVGFRYATQAKARQLGITGWVRNCDDGSVEVYAEGAAEQLQQLMAWLRKGPPSAQVGRVHVRPVTPSGLFQRFSIE